MSIDIIIVIGVCLLLLLVLLNRRKTPENIRSALSLDEELARLIRTLANNPKNEKALFRAGEILFKKSDYTHCLEHLQLLEKLLSKKSDYVFPQLYELYRYMGLANFHLRDYARSMEYLLKLRRLEDPRVDFDVFRTLGILHFQNKNYTRAATLLGRAWQLNPQDVKLGGYVGYSLAELGQWKQAVDTLERVVPELPENFRLQWALAKSYIQLNKFSQAQQLFRELKKVPEFDDHAALEEAKLRLRSKQNVGEALDTLDMLLVAGNGELSCEAGYVLGEYYLSKNSVKKAVWCFEQVKAQDTDYRDVNELLRHYNMLLDTPNLFILMEGRWEQQKTLCRRILRKYYHGKESILGEQNRSREILLTVSMPNQHREAPILLCFCKSDAELTSQRLRDILASLQRKGQETIIHLLGPIEAEAYEFCNSRHITLIERERFLKILSSVGAIEFED